VRLDVTLPRAGNVRVGIYDVLGQRIAVPIDGERHHTFILDTRTHGLSAGVHFMRIEAFGQKATRTFVVVR
jgi:hypothetical protein